MTLASRIASVIVAAAAASLTLGAAPTTHVEVQRLPGSAIQPQAAVDAKGIVHVLYFTGDPAHGDLYYARLDPANHFSAPIRVNSVDGAAIATGTIRGGHLAIGRNGRIHVAWHGSAQALPRSTGGETPVMYTQLNDEGTAFQPERNVVQRRVTGLDGGTLAADGAGDVYVAWHAFEPGLRGEADRRVWIARSNDDGATFGLEAAASPAATGACGCCGVAAMADRRGAIYALYRTATDQVHRDTFLLISRDRGRSFESEKLQDWNIAACPMSTSSLADTPAGVLAAWETDGQVQWARVDPLSGALSGLVAAPGPARNRKHPVMASNDRGDSILVWVEGTGWNRGGDLAWQVFDRDGRTLGAPGRAAGVPAWSMAAVAARPDGTFLVLY